MAGSLYSGIADPGSGSTGFNRDQFHIDQTLATVGTATVVQIMKAPYDADGNDITPGSAVPIGYVDVQPMVNQVDGAGNATPHGTVHRLSYHRYQGGNGAFISDPVVGDIGKMVVANRDTSAVRATNAPANPGSGRRFDLADGTYFGSTQSKAAPTQYFAWLSKGFNITDAYGNTIVGTPTGVLIDGCLIKLNGDVVTTHGTSLDNHVNTRVTTGLANSGPPP